MVLIISFESLKLKKLICFTIVLVGFIYQFYDLTQDYLQYKYLIEFSIESVNNVMSSITVCPDDNLKIIYQDKLKKYEKDVHCYLLYYAGRRKFEKSCYHNFPEVSIRNRNNSLCLTYLGDLKNLSKETDMFFYLFMKANRKVDVMFHPPNTHSHFEKKLYYLKIGKMSMVELRKTEIKSLPSPYSMDCFDYSSNALNKVWPKSQTDCKLEYMRRKESRICGRNYHWIQSTERFKNFKLKLDLKFSNTSQNCKVRENEHEFNQICKDHCLQTFYHVHISESETPKSFENISSLLIRPVRSYYKKITYVGKMSLVKYFSSFGGIISMWMGLSAVSMTDIFYKELNRFLIFIYYSNVYNSINRFKKYTRHIKFVTKLIFFLLMCSQLFDVTQNYLRYPKAIKISFDEKLTFPKMLLSMDFDSNINISLNSIVEQIKCKIHLNQVIIECPRPIIMFHIHKRWTIFRISFFNEQLSKNLTRTYKKCQIKQLKIEFSHLYPNMIMFTFTNQFFSNVNSHPIFASISVLQLYKSYSFFIESNNYRRITLENGAKCQYRESVLFSDFTYDYLINECVLQAINRTLHCIPRYNTSPHIIVEPDLYQEKYKYCPNYIKFNSSKRYFSKCLQTILPDCELQLFDVHNTVHNTSRTDINKEPSTEINIIPVNTIMTQYTEKYRMNFNSLFYEIGGTGHSWSLVWVVGLIPL